MYHALECVFKYIVSLKTNVLPAVWNIGVRICLDLQGRKYIYFHVKVSRMFPEVIEALETASTFITVSRKPKDEYIINYYTTIIMITCIPRSIDNVRAP